MTDTEYDRPSKHMLCPQCKTSLKVSRDTRVYETLAEHIDCSPENQPARKYLRCPNFNCEAANAAFWDFDGYAYLSCSAREWHNKNRIDPSIKSTWKNCGTEAINSFAHDFTMSEIRNNSGIRGIKNRLSTKVGNFSCELRRLYSPYKTYVGKRNKTTLKSRMLYSFGVWLIACSGRIPCGLRDSNISSSWPVDESLWQYLHHPYPWVRWHTFKFISDLCERKCVVFDKPGLFTLATGL